MSLNTPTLQRRIRIYAGYLGNGFGMKPQFPIDETLTLAVAKEASDAIAWHSKRLAYHRRILGRATADRKNGRGHAA